MDGGHTLSETKRLRGSPQRSWNFIQTMTWKSPSRAASLVLLDSLRYESITFLASWNPLNETTSIPLVSVRKFLGFSGSLGSHFPRRLSSLECSNCRKRFYRARGRHLPEQPVQSFRSKKILGPSRRPETPVQNEFPRFRSRAAAPMRFFSGMGLRSSGPRI